MIIVGAFSVCAPGRCSQLSIAKKGNYMPVEELLPCRKCGTPAAPIVPPKDGWTCLIHCLGFCGYHEHEGTIEKTVLAWNRRADTKECARQQPTTAAAQNSGR